jgi:hypothetical protein
MKRTNGFLSVLSAVVLLSAAVNADDDAVSGVSEAASLNTSSVSAVIADQDQDLDTRSYTDAYSPARKLSTKKIVGTMIMMR